MKRTLTVASLLALTALLASGCHLDIDVDDPIFTSHADLRVRWTVDGSNAATICGDLGIAGWRVDISGPDTRRATFSCRADWWDTETDFGFLPFGTYTVSVRALDSAGVTIGAISTTIRIDADRDVHGLAVNFLPGDIDASAKKDVKPRIASSK